MRGARARAHAGISCSMGRSLDVVSALAALLEQPQEIGRETEQQPQTAAVLALAALSAVGVSRGALPAARVRVFVCARCCVHACVRGRAGVRVWGGQHARVVSSTSAAQRVRPCAHRHEPRRHRERARSPARPRSDARTGVQRRVLPRCGKDT